MTERFRIDPTQLNTTPSGEPFGGRRWVSRQAELDDFYSMFITDLKQDNPVILKQEEIVDLLSLINNPDTDPDEKAKMTHRVFKSVERLIPFVIKRLPHNGVPREELIGIAYEVFLGCVANYSSEYVGKSEEPAKFSSYFVASIEPALSSPRNVVEIGKIGEFPDFVKAMGPKIRKAWGIFLQREMKEPTMAQLYLETCMLLSKIPSFTTFRYVYSRYLKTVISVEAGITSASYNIDTLETYHTKIDTPTVGIDDDPEAHAIYQSLREKVEDVLSSLTSRERRILQLRFGLEDGRSRTLEEVGREFDVNRERIRQIEQKALRKLRKPSRAIRLVDYFYVDDRTAEKAIALLNAKRRKKVLG